jgi:hypothetical protein
MLAAAFHMTRHKRQEDGLEMRLLRLTFHLDGRTAAPVPGRIVGWLPLIDGLVLSFALGSFTVSRPEKLSIGWE